MRKYFTALNRYNPVQTVLNKFMKLSKIGLCMECFTADSFRVFNKNVKIWLLGVRLDIRHQIQAFQGLP